MTLQLTAEQKNILEHFNEDLYLSSGPGSAKSTTLSLIADKILKADPANRILLLTFTNRAARDIIAKCSNTDTSRITGGTFHSFAYRTLKENGHEVNVCDESKKRLIIRKIFKEVSREELESIYTEISLEKTCFPYEPSPNTQKYDQELSSYGLSDFDDILYSYISNPLSQDRVTFTHCLVDELQDTSIVQLEMLKKIHSTYNCKMIAASDMDQCIYEWRSARPENINDFIKLFNCRVMNLGCNFRSGYLIVEKSKNLIEHNKNRLKINLYPFKTVPGIVKSFSCHNFHDEIDKVISLCRLAGNKKIAILYRNRIYKNHLEFSLKKAGLDYTVNDFLEITDRSAVKVSMACCKISSGRFDVYDLEQSAKAIKGLGIKTIRSLEEDAHKDSLYDAFNRALTGKLKGRLSCLSALKEFFNAHKDESLDILIKEINKYFNASYEYAPELKQFLIDIAKDYKINTTSIYELCNQMGLNGKEKKENKDALIELSTVHGYKGGQAPIVIIPWSNQFDPQRGKEYDVEAERRLFYVAITRPESELYITHSGPKPLFVKEMK